MPFTPTPFTLTADQRRALETHMRSGRGRADVARRARVLLLLADGCSYATIVTMTGCSSRTIALWKQRFAKDGVAGLAARYRGSKPTVLTPALEARIMTWTRRPPPHGATHWSTRSLGRKLGVQHTIIARAWRHAGLQPHRLERYMRSTDPEFETKAADVAGVLQDVPGSPYLADYQATNAEIAPSLGRNLAACRSQAVCNGTALVPLIAPNTFYDKRRVQLDLRLSREFRIGSRGRLQANVDIYNVLNDGSVLSSMGCTVIGGDSRRALRRRYRVRGFSSADWFSSADN